MEVDLILAMLHHVLVFALAGILCAEFVLVRPGLDDDRLRLVSRIDMANGAVAGLVVVVGICRVIFGLKGWDFYVSSWTFWAKMTAFLAVGALSAPPTALFLQWRKATSASPGYAVPAEAIRRARMFIQAELAIFVLIPVFAAAMARGYGQL